MMMDKFHNRKVSPFSHISRYIYHTPPRKNTKLNLKDLSLLNVLKDKKFVELHVDMNFSLKDKRVKRLSYKNVLKLKKLDSSSTVLSLNSKSKSNNAAQDYSISPICKDQKSFSIQNEEEKQIINTISPQNDKKIKFLVSSKNYFPRKWTCDIEIKKLNIENYFNNNYLPSQLNMEESEISQNYILEMKNQNNNNKYNISEGMGYNCNYRANTLISSTKPNNLNFNNNNCSINYPNINNSSSTFQMFNDSNNKSKFDNNNYSNIYVSNFNDNLNLNPGVTHKSTSSSFSPQSNDETFIKINNINQPRKYSCAEETNRERKNCFVERQGDWVCIRCKNLNFSFRVVCNRCKLPKNEVNNFYEEYVRNLSNIVQYNEMLQIQVNQTCPNNFLNNIPNNYIQNNNILNNNVFNSNLFSLNTSNYYTNKSKTNGTITKESLHMK